MIKTTFTRSKPSKRAQPATRPDTRTGIQTVVSREVGAEVGVHIYSRTSRIGTVVGGTMVGGNIGRLINDVSQGKRGVSALYADDTMDRVAVVRKGLPAAIIHQFATQMKVTKEQVYVALGIHRQTVDRKKNNEAVLNLDASERGVCVAGLIGQIEAMTKGLDTNGVSAAEWVAQWLPLPHPALNAQTPLSLLDTADGRLLVRRLLAQMEAGAYA